LLNNNATIIASSYSQNSEFDDQVRTLDQRISIDLDIPRARHLYNITRLKEIEVLTEEVDATRQSLIKRIHGERYATYTFKVKSKEYDIKVGDTVLASYEKFRQGTDSSKPLTVIAVSKNRNIITITATDAGAI
jgi:hypothetical protein